MSPSFQRGAVAIIHLSSVGAGYRLLNSCTSPVEVLELIPAAQGCLCLVVGEPQKLMDLIRHQRSATLLSSDVIENLDPRVLEAFYSLANPKLGSLLLTIESPSLGRLFRLANTALTFNFEILEFRAPRAGQTKGLLSLSAKQQLEQLDSEQEYWIHRLNRDPDLAVEKIHPLSDSLRAFFPS